MLGDAYLTKVNKLKIQWILPIFICTSIIEIFFVKKTPYVLSVPIEIIGVACIWNIYDKTISTTFKLNEHPLLKISSNFTFFIYLYHEPSLNIVRKIMVAICGQTSFGFAISYLVSPWIFAICAVLIGITLKKALPSFYSIIVGGR